VCAFAASGAHVRAIDYGLCLAKQLKDARFPGLEFLETCREQVFPTLEELIEALPATIQFSLIRNIDSYHITTLDDLSCDGSTPTEAVARSWLALNKKV
jgi:hypothetical protein